MGASSLPNSPVGMEEAEAGFFGTYAYTRVGEGMASAGDVNGDGKSDLLIGAQTHLPGWSGKAYLLFSPY